MAAAIEEVMDLEQMLLDEPPPGCQMTKDGKECGKPAVSRVRLHCAACGWDSRPVRLCLEHQKMVQEPGNYFRCKHCAAQPMEIRWLPL